jgi:S-disulfanyl-L-cysteine oxidoreductase SoxD
MRSATLVIVAIAALIAAGCVHTAGAAGPTYGLGRPADPAEIAALDIDVSPDGTGLPDGRGDAVDGAQTFAAACARCHGAAVRLDPQRWPYATTLFDYVRRAMPPDRSTRLRPNEVYAITAYELAVNGVIARGDVLDRTSLPRVTMPGLKAFFTPP